MEHLSGLFTNLWSIIGGILLLIAIAFLFVSGNDARKWLFKKIHSRLEGAQDLKVFPSKSKKKHASNRISVASTR